jgi:DNA-binding protein YbaB
MWLNYQNWRKVMKATYSTTVRKDDEKNATGLQVPDEAVAALGSGKKPKVKVSLNGYTYRTTVAVMDRVFMIPLSQEHRAAAGVKGGDVVEVILELDTEPRIVEIPDDLSAALKAQNALDAFDRLAYTARKEFVRQVETAKAQETRQRRIAGIVAKLSSS